LQILQLEVINPVSQIKKMLMIEKDVKGSVL
jgi:hypothetical protein